MIFDNIKNRAIYDKLGEKFTIAFNFIEKVEREGADVGRYELDGSNVYAMVQEYSPKAESDMFEAHKNYIDVQFILSGKEYMECASAKNCTVTDEYMPDKDAALYICNGLKVTLEAEQGDFAVFYPHDIHKPGLKCGDCEKVRKIVVKVRV